MGLTSGRCVDWQLLHPSDGQPPASWQARCSSKPLSAAASLLAGIEAVLTPHGLEAVLPSLLAPSSHQAQPDVRCEPAAPPSVSAFPHSSTPLRNSRRSPRALTPGALTKVTMRLAHGLLWRAALFPYWMVHATPYPSGFRCRLGEHTVSHVLFSFSAALGPNFLFPPLWAPKLFSRLTGLPFTLFRHSGPHFPPLRASFFFRHSGPLSSCHSGLLPFSASLGFPFLGFLLLLIHLPHITRVNASCSSNPSSSYASMASLRQRP